MTFLIHTPNFHTYAFIILLLLCWGNQTLSSMFHIQIRRFFNFNIIQTSNIWNALIVLFGTITFKVAYILKFNSNLFAINLIIGFLCGIALYVFELKFNRFYFNRFSKIVENKLPTDRKQTTKIKLNSRIASISTVKKNTYLENKFSVLKKNNDFNVLNKEFRMFDVVISAVLEELLYRGLLLHILIPCNEPYRTLYLILSCIFFGVSHLAHGWNQFICKFVMSLIFLGMSILTGNILGAIVAHVTFNYIAYKYTKKNSSRLKSNTFRAF